jgi:hypothetical protein
MDENKIQVQHVAMNTGHYCVAKKKLDASVSVSGVSAICMRIRHFVTFCCSWRARAGQFGPR